MHSQHQTYLREYTYFPHGSGIVYITIVVDGSWGGIDLLREGPRCPESLIAGTLHGAAGQGHDEEGATQLLPDR